MTRIVASIEARMTSTRLPGKSLELIGGIPAIELVILRAKKVPEVGGIVLATPQDPVNEPLWDIARRHRISVVKGSEQDVLARVTLAHKEMHSDICVRVCGDQVFLDPGTISDAIRAYRADLGDYITTTRDTGYPVGVDAEVFAFESLEQLNMRALSDHYREHVSLYWYEHPDRSTLRCDVYELEPHPALSMGDLRLCLDTAEDLTYLREVADEFGWDCTTEEILEGIRHGRCRKLVEGPPSDPSLSAKWVEAFSEDSPGVLGGDGQGWELALRDTARGEARRTTDHYDRRYASGYRHPTLSERTRKGDRRSSFENGDLFRSSTRDH